MSILMPVQMIYCNQKKNNILTLFFVWTVFFRGALEGAASVGSSLLFFLLTSTFLPASMLVGTNVVHAFFLT
ncbi:hypothetical protein [Thermoactinomyces mirandus]|uniref:hypothetical protein n=1 Tax=Thermoactinomyces mirandus TaxID=2756294 RepID=UPI0015EF478F|nr:hypothetical protein [Thermoactinomyces mirandus]